MPAGSARAVVANSHRKEISNELCSGEGWDGCECTHHCSSKAIGPKSVINVSDLQYVRYASMNFSNSMILWGMPCVPVTKNIDSYALKRVSDWMPEAKEQSHVAHANFLTQHVCLMSTDKSHRTA